MINKLKAILDNRIIKNILIAMVAAIAIEFTVMNFSAYRSMGLKSVTILKGADTDASGFYMSELINVDSTVKNVSIDIDTEIVPYATAVVYITDEGDKYEYPLPELRVAGGMPYTGMVNIYPYGKVNTIRVSVSVPEGASAHINNISCNASWPFRIRILRIAVLALIIAVFGFAWSDIQGRSLFCNEEDDQKIKDRQITLQRIAVLAVILLLIGLGIILTKSNERLVNSPWPHHRQYQELAHSLRQGQVALTDKEVDPALLEVDNPYDTIALQAEGIFFHMDYAYYNGQYFAYFGIIPELLFYLPFYILTGRDMSNIAAMTILWIVFVPSIFLLTGQLLKRLSDRIGIRIGFFSYLLLSIGICLFSNHIHMVSRADIYNIPVMTATVLINLGIGLWLLAANTTAAPIRYASLAAGSLSMAMVAGARPQMLLYSIAVIPLFYEELKVMTQSGDNGTVPQTKGRLGFILCVIIPYMIIAAVVAWYNYVRFGNILDFGATYSLTTNDMNHRGFNLDRVARGLFSFFLQPVNLTHDFPYLVSSAVKSNYMGRNPSEYVYGGIFVTNVMTLILAVPAIVKEYRNRIPGFVKFTAILMTLSSVIIAAFDANGAGILYRYTSDVVPGIIIASLLLWFIALDERYADALTVRRVMTLAVLLGIGYSFLVFMGTSGSPTIKDDSVRVYEMIRSYFRI